MTKYFHHSLLIALSVSAASLFFAACSSGDDDSNPGTGGATGSGGTSATGGTSGSAGTGTTTCTPGGNVVLTPDPTGWVDKNALCNDVGVQGAWYPYGDQYGNGNGAKKCVLWGNHMSSECAQIMSPDPSVMKFDNTDGAMHTVGAVELVLPCVAGSMAATIPTSGCPGNGQAGGFDYSSMWGSGIGLDLNADKGPPDGTGMKHPWNPDMYGIIGIRFTIEHAPPALRVEFPMLLLDSEAAADVPPLPPGSTTDDHSAGAPYWGAKPDKSYGNSPVVEGVNTITWDQVSPPQANIYVFDKARILGIQFHVPTNTTSGSTYDFTIKDLTFLRSL
jgi:hypothetical protein